jgi:hypothetical protein
LLCREVLRHYKLFHIIFQHAETSPAFCKKLPACSVPMHSICNLFCLTTFCNFTIYIVLDITKC